MSFPKNIILAVTGSISAYKSAPLSRLITQKSSTLKVILSKGGADFITPLTLSTVSNNPVYTDFFNPKDGTWVNHVELGLWADLLIVAPATANTIAHLANGLCSELLHAVYLSAKCPVVICPAMDHDMWHHKATQRNINLLKQDGCHIIPPAKGELASGIIGDGRLPEPIDIIKHIEAIF